uniref:Uncharacterized protein n=1 Tax=Arundo donax TaxID=35708 RepID=A0A0A8YV94_ARUDO
MLVLNNGIPSYGIPTSIPKISMDLEKDYFITHSHLHINRFGKKSIEPLFY